MTKGLGRQGSSRYAGDRAEDAGVRGEDSEDDYYSDGQGDGDGEDYPEREIDERNVKREELRTVLKP